MRANYKMLKIFDFFMKMAPPVSKGPSILFLLPPSSIRLEALSMFLNEESIPERFLFYGWDYFLKKGFSVAHNVFPPSNIVTSLGELYRRLVLCFGGCPGELKWVLPVLPSIYHSDAIVAFSERMVFPLLYLRSIGLLPRCPMVNITIGLPEKMDFIRNNTIKKCIVEEFGKLDAIITLSQIEAESLISDYQFSDNVVFIPAGVDTNYFYPLNVEESIDVLSIGADSNRDFSTLIEAARLLPQKSFLIVTSLQHAKNMREIPKNIRLLIDVPMTDIRAIIASSRIVALPVKDNSYSGGTTVMLQSMAMGKVVIANCIGANKKGYGFKHDNNCFFVEPADSTALIEAIENLLGDPSIRIRIGKAAQKHIEQFLTIEEFHRKLYQQVTMSFAKRKTMSEE